MSRVKIITAEKSYVIRAGFNKIINSYKDVEVVKEIENLKKIKTLSAQIKPDILIVNIKMLDNPHVDLRTVYKIDGKIRLIAIVGTKKKNEKFVHFNETICIDDNKLDIDKKILSVINSLPKRKRPEKSGLSEREKDIVRLIALGKTNKEIAGELFLSIHTVITHRKNITKKLEIKTVSGITVYAIINKIISLETINNY